MVVTYKMPVVQKEDENLGCSDIYIYYFLMLKSGSLKVSFGDISLSPDSWTCRIWQETFSPVYEREPEGLEPIFWLLDSSFPLSASEPAA